MGSTCEPTGFAPIDIATGMEIPISMEELRLVGELWPVGARLVVRHTFTCGSEEPVEVLYAFGLPRDAALRRFQVKGEEFEVHSALKPVKDAVEDYERGIEEGRLSTPARQYGDGLVNLSLGDVRSGETITVYLEVLAGVEARDNGFRLRFPFTLGPCCQQEARAVAAEPDSGEIDLPEDRLGDLILPPFRAGAETIHRVGFNLTVLSPVAIASAVSPSHRIHVRCVEPGRTGISLAAGSDLPDRDLVLDVQLEEPKPIVLAGTDEAGKGQFAVRVPSSAFGDAGAGPRRVVFVIDRSGSMGGRPMVQAKKALAACLAALSPDDRFGIVAFDDRTDVFANTLAPGDGNARQAAMGFIERIDARGGTELLAAVNAAAKILGGGGGDILLLTDGQVYETEEIVSRARWSGARIHCLGIGGASQDRCLALLARETGGMSRFVTPRERVDTEALELFGSIGRPVAGVVTVFVDGLNNADVAPEPSGWVFADTPALFLGETDGPGAGKMVIEWRREQETGGAPQRMEIPLEVGGGPWGRTLALLRANCRITDLESRLLPDGAGCGVSRLQEKRLNNQLEKISRQHGLASRAMVLVAVLERKGDRAGALPSTTVVPLGMPQDTPFDACFAGTVLNDASSVMEFKRSRPESSIRLSGKKRAVADPTDPLPDAGAVASSTRDSSFVSFAPNGDPVDPPGRTAARTTDDFLVELAGRLEPDGGMPGTDARSRIAASALALACYFVAGSSPERGPFKLHMARLLVFLEDAVLDTLEDEQRQLLRLVVETVRQDGPLPAQWFELARWYMGNEDPAAGIVWQKLAQGTL